MCVAVQKSKSPSKKSKSPSKKSKSPKKSKAIVKADLSDESD
jgi:hypothetical protein